MHRIQVIYLYYIQNAQSFFTNYQPIQEVTIIIKLEKLEKLEISDLYLIKDAIVTLINVKGRFTVKIDGME